MIDATVQFETWSAWSSLLDAACLFAKTEQVDTVLNDASSGDCVRADAKLVTAALKGESDAFSKIIETYQGTIASQMRRFSRDQRIIEELVHDVFVEAYMSLGSFRADSPLIHWLRKIAVRVGYRYWKRQSRKIEQAVSLSEIEENLEQLVDRTSESRREASEVLGRLLEALSVRDRLVLTLLYWDGCSVKEAAELAGWSQTMVKVQAFRARKRLKKLIERSLK